MSIFGAPHNLISTDTTDYGRPTGKATTKAIDVLIERRNRLAERVTTLACSRKEQADEFTRNDAAIANQIEELQSAVLELGDAIINLRAMDSFEQRQRTRLESLDPPKDQVAPTERSYDILAGRL